MKDPSGKVLREVEGPAKAGLNRALVNLAGGGGRGGGAGGGGTRTRRRAGRGAAAHRRLHRHGGRRRPVTREARTRSAAPVGRRRTQRHKGHKDAQRAVGRRPPAGEARGTPRTFSRMFNRLGEGSSLCVSATSASVWSANRRDTRSGDRFRRAPSRPPCFASRARSASAAT